MKIWAFLMALVAIYLNAMPQPAVAQTRFVNEQGYCQPVGTTTNCNFHALIQVDDMVHQCYARLTIPYSGAATVAAEPCVSRVIGDGTHDIGRAGSLPPTAMATHHETILLAYWDIHSTESGKSIRFCARKEGVCTPYRPLQTRPREE